MQLTGFSISESDAIIDLALDASPTRRLNKEDRIHEPAAATAITRPGDVWIMNGRHRVLCGSALEAESYTHLMQGAKARLVFTDPPYNVPIDGFVSGLGQVQHRAFPMASGEMNEVAASPRPVPLAGPDTRPTRLIR